MKKMMVIACACLMSAFVNAGQVDWTMADVCSGSGSYYIFALGGASDTFGNGGFNTTTFELIGGATYTSASVANYTINGGSYWTASEIVLTWNNTSGVADTSSSSIINQYWAVVTVDAATPTLYGVDVFQVTGQSSIATGGYPRENNVFNVSQYTTVPEPTSMALLALGVAAVGLRRRFKK
jgi:hypothetical protein